MISKKKKGLRQNSEWLFGRNPKFKAFFRPKLGDLQKKRSSPKFRVIFWPKSEIQSFFPPTIRWSPKKKRSSPKFGVIFWPKSEIQSYSPPKKKKKRSSPKFRVIFWPKSEIQSFFPPKIRWSPKKKKKKRSSPKLRLLFRAISQIQTFEGGLFSNGGGYFPFFTENRPQKHKKHAILHTSPRAPPLATLLFLTDNKQRWAQRGLFTSGATFSVAVAATPLLFFVTSDKRQRRCFLAEKAAALQRCFLSKFSALPLLLINSFQDFFNSHFHTLPFGVFTLRLFSLCFCYLVIWV